MHPQRPSRLPTSGGHIASWSNASVCTVASCLPRQGWLEAAWELGTWRSGIAGDWLDAARNTTSAAFAVTAASAPPMWNLLLDFTNGNGLAARWRFARDPPSAWAPALASAASASSRLLLLEFSNNSTMPFTHVSLAKAQLGHEQQMIPFWVHINVS